MTEPAGTWRSGGTEGRPKPACSASEVRFLRGRVRFHTPDGVGIHKTEGGGGSTIGPSAVVIYSPAGGPPRYTYMPARLPAQASLLE